MIRFLLLAAGIMMFALNSHSQCDEGEIQVHVHITPDNYPNETSWDIRTHTGTIVAAGNVQGNTVCLPDNECYRFTIYDSYGDGICCGYGLGHYFVAVDGDTIVQGGEFQFSESTYFNCQPGQICNEAIPVLADTWYQTSYDNTWYQFQASQTGIYQISTCSPLNTCHTAIWVYESCANINVTDDNSGTLFYSNSGCGSQALAQTHLASGQQYIIRIGSQNNHCAGQSIAWMVQYSGPLTGCTDPLACNYNPMATVSDSTLCQYQGDPLCPEGPDLIVLEAPLKNSLYVATINNNDNCLIQEQCVKGYGLRQVLRFTTHIENIGNQDFYIGPTPSSPGTPSTQWTYDNCHGHWHYEGYAEYLLFDADGVETPAGFKNGFCVMDLDCTLNGGTPKYNCTNQGITAQCGDIYGAYLQCQWIDITDIEAGQYTLVVRVNWDQSPDVLGNHETNYLNNWAQVCINLTRHPVTNYPSVSIVEDCAPFVDCLGDIYGSAQPDCKGICDGPAIRGDINEDGQRNYQDVTRYMYESLADTLIPVTCIDLNDDNLINVVDAALVLDCVLHGTNPPLEHTHTPCVYPYKVHNPFDTVYLRVGQVNMVEGYADIEMKNPSNTYLGYQFSVSGIVISGVNSLLMDFETNTMFNPETGEVISLSFQEDLIDKSNVYRPVLRLFFAETLNEELCIDNITAFVNKDYEEVNLVIEGPCGHLGNVSTGVVPPLSVTIQPNPMTTFTTVWFKSESGAEAEMRLYDLHGRLLNTLHSRNNVPFELDRGNLAAGIYTIRVIAGKQSFTGTIAVH